MSSFETVLCEIAGPVATITLNQPDALNTIVPPMPDEVASCVGSAVRDPAVKVIVVRGAGRAFCAGYDFGEGFHHWDEGITTEGEWDPGKDFALCSDLVVASEDAVIGTPYSRVWGVYLSGMWI
jgi:enoyl-CoA hydratase